MKKFQYSQTVKKIVRESISQYLKELGFNHYEGTIVWHTKEKDNSQKGREDFTTTAAIKVDHRYLDYQLNIYPELQTIFKSEGEEGIKRIVSHEIGHIATHHLYHMATALYKDEGEMDDAHEALTTIVGRLIYEAVDKKSRHLKKR